MRLLIDSTHITRLHTTLHTKLHNTLRTPQMLPQLTAILLQAPLYRPWSNHVHCGVWTAMSFIACVAIAHTHMQLPGLSYTDQAHKMAWVRRRMPMECGYRHVR